LSQSWKLVFPGLGNQRQEDCELEASIGYKKRGKNGGGMHAHTLWNLKLSANHAVVECGMVWHESSSPWRAALWTDSLIGGL
jgi:hypothetical protein